MEFLFPNENILAEWADLFDSDSVHYVDGFYEGTHGQNYVHSFGQNKAKEFPHCIYL